MTSQTDDRRDTTESASAPCIVCHAALADVMAGQEHNQPSCGVAFRATGGYGSGVFDPYGTGEVLDINVCDRCLLAAARAGLVQTARVQRTVVETDRGRWDPPADEGIDG